MTTCAWCGEEAELDILEVWGAHEFQLLTCCSDAYEATLDDLNDPTYGPEACAELSALLRGYGVACRQVFRSECRGQIMIDAGLRIEPITRGEAKEFIREHHRHNPPPAGDRFRFAAWNGEQLVAVVMVGRPVARAIDHTRVVEVNRLCVDHGLDRELTWKACSLLYTAAADEARERGFEKAITYTLESERGMSLRYARWKPVGTTKGGTWNRPSRPRTDKAPTCKKTRWERRLAA